MVLNQFLFVGFRWFGHNIGNLTEQFIMLRLTGLLRAATASVFIIAAATAAQVAVRFDLTAFASVAERFGLAALTLSTCPLRSRDRHWLNHYYSDQTKIDGGAN